MGKERENEYLYLDEQRIQMGTHETRSIWIVVRRPPISSNGLQSNVDVVVIHKAHGRESRVDLKLDVLLLDLFLVEHFDLGSGGIEEKTCR